MADRVFEDRVGLWVVSAERFQGDRAASARRWRGGMIRDVFLPRTASAAHAARVRSLGFNAHLWVAVDGRTPAAMATETLADIARIGPGAVDLNIEVEDVDLPVYLRDVTRAIRSRRPHYRIRWNLAAYKAGFAPVKMLVEDRALYVAVQCYGGAMEPYSQADIYWHARAYGIPDEKLTICYGAAGPDPRGQRVGTLPDLARRQRGVIFHDDLMVDGGYL